MIKVYANQGFGLHPHNFCDRIDVVRVNMLIHMNFYSTSEEFLRVYEVCAPWRERVRVCYARIALCLNRLGGCYI